ncbi:hypothetical protein E2C01_093716 [Portunus trituberculatus]|uniref:Uncharacterized protein n=1 Tax=Portunus trituberculatus TaxID=210409 RepID=A0A5B7JU91_PORTR|nr:hypothetical protein [Portunus trituberculatus]
MLPELPLLLLACLAQHPLQLPVYAVPAIYRCSTTESTVIWCLLHVGATPLPTH